MKIFCSVARTSRILQIFCRQERQNGGISFNGVFHVSIPYLWRRCGGTAFERVVVLERRFSGTEIFHCIDNFSLYLL